MELINCHQYSKREENLLLHVHIYGHFGRDYDQRIIHISIRAAMINQLIESKKKSASQIFGFQILQSSLEQNVKHLFKS